MSKEEFAVGEVVYLATKTPAYGAFTYGENQPTVGRRLRVYSIGAADDTDLHVIDDDGLVQVLRKEDVVRDLRDKFQPSQRVRVVAKVPSFSAWDDESVTGREGVVISRPSDRPQSEEYPSGFVVTVVLDGTTYSQVVNPEDLEPLEN